MDSYEFSASNPLRVKKRALERQGDDDVNRKDEAVEQDLGNKAAFQRKKRQHYLASYSSDSSNDDESDSEGPVEPNKDATTLSSNKGYNNDSGLEDMFASEDDTERDKESNKFLGKKQLKTLDIDKFNEENLENSNESLKNSTTIEGDDSIKIEAFNIEEESKNGIFDEDGNYIEAEEEPDNAVQNQDLWIQDYKDVKKTAEAQRKLTQMNEQKIREVQRCQRTYMLEEALTRLQYFLSENETILDTLGKFNKLRENQLRNRASDHGGMLAKDYLVNAINFLSDLIAILESKGIADVYDLNRVKVKKLIKEESFTELVTDDYKTELWHFKWLNKTEEIHGLFTNYQMQYWKQSYFNHRAAVKFCDEADEKRNWIHIDCITFI